MKNKIIIIGNDHINTLGVIRTFGENGIKPYVFIISTTNVVSVIKSKYIEKYWICHNEDTALLTIMSIFSDEKEKPVIIPTSDLACYKIDENLINLSKKFIVPNIDCKQGNTIKYMNKYNQHVLLKENNINNAKSIYFNLNKIDDYSLEVVFPCILKPIISAKGQKSDITICENFNELKEAIQEFKKNNYTEVLYQEFINYDYELDICGFTYNKETSIAGVLKKVRIWPEKKGSTTFGIAQPIDAYKNIVKDISNIMKKLNYNGIFDIECFVQKDNYYINEINFRNSAISYAYDGAYICYNWYLSNISGKINKSNLIKEEYNFIDDQSDLHNVLDGKITYKEYKKSLKQSNICLASNKNDNIVAKHMKINKILNKLKINSIRNNISKIFHKDVNGYILRCKYKDLINNHINNDYKVMELTLDNYKIICEDKNGNKEIEDMLKSNNVLGIALIKNEKLICRGFIKRKGAKDRYFNIKDEKKLVLSHILVNEEFRGKKYQCDLILELINKINNLKNETTFYSFVYEYNIPSYKNFYKLGFEKIFDKAIIRFMKTTINKVKLGG